MAIAEAFNQPEPAQSFDMWPFFRSLTTKPVLIVRGEKSDLLSAETSEAMTKAGDRVELVTVPGVPHAPTLEEPVAISAVDRFLARWT
jgi:pimeloyl-ACP methyl ester carboxylesterase